MSSERFYFNLYIFCILLTTIVFSTLLAETEETVDISDEPESVEALRGRVFMLLVSSLSDMFFDIEAIDEAEEPRCDMVDIADALYCLKVNV